MSHYELLNDACTKAIQNTTYLQKSTADIALITLHMSNMRHLDDIARAKRTIEAIQNGKRTYGVEQ